MRKNVVITLLLLLIVGVQAVLIAAPRVMALSDRKATRKVAALSKLTPVTVETVQGSDYKRLTLTSKAAQRIDLQTAPVREEQIVRRRVVPGELIKLPVAPTIVTASVDGVVAALNGALPGVGTQVQANASVLRLAVAAVAAEKGIEPAARVPAAQPARKGNRPVAGLPPVLQTVAVAQDAKSVDVAAPRNAVLTRVFVTAGQKVQEGDRLFEIADGLVCAVKVPVVSDLEKINEAQPISILPVNYAGGATLRAKRIEAPALKPDPEDKDAKEAKDAKDSGRALYFAIESAEPCAGSNMRVRAAFDLSTGNGPRKVVPYASLVYDASGKAWVYANTQALSFMRHPVTVDFVEGDVVVLTAGPPSGTKVVTTGAIQLYGSEFFVGH